MIEAADVDAAGGVTLRLVFQGRHFVAFGLVPLRLVIKLDDVAIGVVATIGRPVAELRVRPADRMGRAFQRGDAPLQRLRAARAERGMTNARRFRSP